ncbi:MAG: SAM-dependent chlorinase/fluorinase [Nitrospirota bacterium]|nr:MAG: SAM-dependent chlorinase/fluorinase [Nitrospirota bacterium]
MNRAITLLTDFGNKDPFVSQMKGVILGINDEVQIVDITHEISRHHIREAAVTIGMSYEYFPPLTVHTCVVDPGVGSGRRPIIVAIDDHYFVGPDNGIFSYIFATHDIYQVIHVRADHYFVRKDSSTCHGRDIFSPVAAWLAKGVPLENFGDEIDDYINLNLPMPQRTSESNIEGEVIYIDNFGNAITNIALKDLGTISKHEILQRSKVLCKGSQIELKSYYSDVNDKALYALFNSNDMLELFVYRGSAVEANGIKIGDAVGIVV